MPSLRSGAQSGTIIHPREKNDKHCVKTALIA